MLLLITKLTITPEPPPEPEIIRSKTWVKAVVNKAPGGRYNLEFWQNWLATRWNG